MLFRRRIVRMTVGLGSSPAPFDRVVVAEMSDGTIWVSCGYPGFKDDWREIPGPPRGESLFRRVLKRIRKVKR